MNKYCELHEFVFNSIHVDLKFNEMLSFIQLILTTAIHSYGISSGI